MLLKMNCLYNNKNKIYTIDDVHDIVKSEECPVCYRGMNHPFVLNNCKHIVCFDCMDTMYKNINKYEWFNKCPICSKSSNNQEHGSFFSDLCFRDLTD